MTEKTTEPQTLDSDQLFWEVVYRCLMSIAAAVKKFKMKQPDKSKPC